MNIKLLCILMAFVYDQANVSEINEKISFTLKNDLAINVTIAVETSNLILQSGAA